MPVKCTIGPERAIIIQGILSKEHLIILENLLNIFHNRVVLHDNRERDTLTQLSNRQSLESRLMEVYFQKHPALEISSWTAMLDIDHFKRLMMILDIFMEMKFYLSLVS